MRMMREYIKKVTLRGVLGVALLTGALAYSGSAILVADNECCTDSAGCWELHDWNTDYMCCFCVGGSTGPCVGGGGEGYCKNTGGEWCTPCPE